MTAGLLIVTFAPDAPFFAVLARSIERHVTGFRRIMVVVPRQQSVVFEPLLRSSADGVPMELVRSYEPEKNGHLFQTITKTFADTLLPDCEMIAHMDADCVFTRATTPESYLRNGRIQILACPFETAGNSKVWQPYVEKLLGMPVPFDTMRCCQLAYWKNTHTQTRAIVERNAGVPFVHAAFDVGCWPEFCALGFMGSWVNPHDYAIIYEQAFETWPDTHPPFTFKGWSRHRETPDGLVAEIKRLETQAGL
jgi:hypothetical protein